MSQRIDLRKVCIKIDTWRSRPEEISLIPPYTINGKLITFFERQLDYCYFATLDNERHKISLANFWRGHAMFDMSEVRQKMPQHLLDIFLENDNYEHLLENISKQHKKIKESNNDNKKELISTYLETLLEQKRINLEIYRIQLRCLSNFVSIPGVSTNYFLLGEPWITPDTIRNTPTPLPRPRFDFDTNRQRQIDAQIEAWRALTLNCEPSFKTFYSKEYIHSYNYTPDYIKHFTKEEEKDEYTTLLLGAEIEVDCGGESEDHAKAGLEIICGINSESNRAKEDKMYCTHDGSLKAGIEFDTMPCSLEYHKTQMRYKELFKYLDKNGYKAHDTETCGLHIHAGRKYLGKTKLLQEITISKILYILERFNDEICIIARQNNQYSKFVGKAKQENSVIELYGVYKREGKKVALNLMHQDTIEFRCFKGTLKYETFILTLEFVKTIIDYAKEINIEQIEHITWKDVYNKFSEELKEYYNKRKSKAESIVKSDFKESKTERGNIYSNVNNIVIDEITNMTMNQVSEIMRRQAEECIHQSLISN